jgi:Fe-S cluster assembly iron-binding protein IscA
MQRIGERKAEISEEEWQRCESLGHEYLRRFAGRWRNGSPLHSAGHLVVQRPSPAASGELVRLTPAAATELRRLAGQVACVVEVRCVKSGLGFRHQFDLVNGPTPCAASCVSEGIRIQIPDELSAGLIQGTEIDFVSSERSKGFAFHNPNAQGN